MRGCIAAVVATAFASAASGSTTAWVDALELVVRGRGFDSAICDLPYSRLPKAAQGVVTDAVWNLQRDSAGQFVQFVSDSSALSVNATYVYRTCSMWHFPSTGVCGLDLYAWDPTPATWRWVGTTHTNEYPTSVNTLGAVGGGVNTTYRLHLPLYNAPSALSIGYSTARGATLRPDAAYAPKGKPIVWYGTSIAQGGVVTRPGMAFTNAIARDLGREVRRTRSGDARTASGPWPLARTDTDE
jgi:hypothetical protein